MKRIIFFDKKHHSTLLAQALKGLGNPFEWNELFHLNFPRTPASTKSFVILHFRFPPGYYVGALVLPRWSLTNATSSREGIMVIIDELDALFCFKFPKNVEFEIGVFVILTFSVKHSL